MMASTYFERPRHRSNNSCPSSVPFGAGQICCGKRVVVLSCFVLFGLSNLSLVMAEMVVMCCGDNIDSGDKVAMVMVASIFARRASP